MALVLWLGWIALTIGWWATHSGIVRMLERWEFGRFGATAHWATFVLLQTIPLFVTWTIGRRWSVVAPLSVLASILVSAGLGAYLGRSDPSRRVEVSHPGKGTAQVLRHDFSLAKPIIVTVELAWSQNISGKVVTEPVSLVLELTPRRLSRGGALRYDFVVRAIGLSGSSALGSFLSSRFDGASSARGWATVRPDGSLDTVKLVGGYLAEDGLGLLREIRWVIGRLHAPFPETPVGVGAAWQVSQAVDLQGIEVQREARYELVSLEGDVATIEIVGTEKLLKPMKLSAAGARTAMLLESDERFQGEMSFRLGTLDTYVDVDTDFHEAVLDGFERRDGDLEVAYTITPK